MNFLYGSKDKYPERYILKPRRIINTKIILEEEMNIKRVIASLGIKRTTVSTVIKKINFSPKSNKTRKALAEFDKIIRSIYLLNYIDDIKLRQYVQKAINRQELYHKLRRKVGFDNGGKIMAKPDSKQIIYQECNRLICNMIVHYNSFILTEFLKQKQGKNLKEQIELLKKISPIAWRHINFYGRYDFKSKDEVNFKKIIKPLANTNIA